MINVRASIADLDRVLDPTLRAEFGQLRRNSLLTGCADPSSEILGLHVEGSRQELQDLAWASRAASACSRAALPAAWPLMSSHAGSTGSAGASTARTSAYLTEASDVACFGSLAAR